MRLLRLLRLLFSARELLVRPRRQLVAVADNDSADRARRDVFWDRGRDVSWNSSYVGRCSEHAGRCDNGGCDDGGCDNGGCDNGGCDCGELNVGCRSEHAGRCDNAGCDDDGCDCAELNDSSGPSHRSRHDDSSGCRDKRRG